MQRALLTLSLAILVATPSSRPLAADGAARAEFFEQRIRPVLVESCYECHSATSKKVKGGLRVDGRAELLKGGETGPSIVPGKADDSLLIAAISHKDKELAMPPKKPALPASVVVDFRQWVNEGAFWPGQETAAATKGEGFDLEQRKRQWPWIWETPRRQPLPKVARQDWPVSDTDYFLLARLEAKQLAPAPRADDRTWLRRVSFALTGLPPSPLEIHAFLADHSTTARARVVDRLLASPHYGERWARHWMDLVRYAESRGHESDYIIPNAYHYRDYLIRAFNTDVPYDQFVREHLAGDLVAAPRLNPVTGGNESVLATGWAFLGEEVHSPVDIRQDECDRIDNKVDVLSKTFLGLTVACARCHDHKFDALTAKDYYALSGFVLGSSYRQVRFEAMEQNRAIVAELAALRARSRKPVLAALGETLRPALKDVPAYLLAARESLLAPDGTNVLASIAKRHSLDVGKLGLWRARLQAAATNAGHPLQFIAGAMIDRAGEDAVRLAKHHADASAGCGASLPKDVRVIVDFNDPAHQPWKADGPGFGEGPLPAGAIRWGADLTNPVLRVMRHGAAVRDPFWNRLKTAPNNQNDPGSLAATTRAGQMVRTPTFTLQTGKLFYLIKGRAVAYAAVDSHILVEGPLHGRLVQKMDSGPAEAPRWVEHDLTAYIGHRTHVEFGPSGEAGLEVLMVVEATQKPAFVPGGSPWIPAAVPTSLAALTTSFQHDLGVAREALSKDQVQSSPDLPRTVALADWLASNVDLFMGTDLRAWERAVTDYTQGVAALRARVQWESRTAVAWFDGTGLDESVLVRGKPFRPGPVAPRSLPVAFHGAKPIAATASSGRLELAEQMVDPDNSLVARVIVNRVWHHLFGRGIVATVDNFGILGERPTHPELLDHLAWQFVHEDHWSLKQLVRRLVLSSAYAMSSQPADSRAEEADPSNLLLHRMPVRRLEAEAIRDSLLAVSGRLNQSVGGAPVEVHLTEFVIGRGRPEKGGPLDGDGRRSLYTAARRNFLPTMMLAFDLPTPFSTVGKRNVTNVPAQSLALMNDELFHEQARVWAGRMSREAGTDEPSARIRWLFETAYGRMPAEAELTACRDTLRELEQSNAAGSAGKESWVELCHALLNANDFIYLK